MKLLLVFLVLSSSSTFAEYIEVYAQKVSTKAACFTKMNCSEWQGEYECERSGTKMFFDSKTTEMLENLPSDYSYSVSKTCNELKRVGSFRNGKSPSNLTEVLKIKGSTVDLVVYPNQKYFFKNL